MNKTKIEWTDYNRGWIEALIDGEGSLSLLKEKRLHFRAGVTYKPRLNIANNNISLLQHAQEIIGAGCIVRRKIGGLYLLDVSANGIRNLLPKIKLIAKEHQQGLLLEALKILDRKVGKSRPRTGDEIKRLEEIAIAIRKENNTYEQN